MDPDLLPWSPVPCLAQPVPAASRPWKHGQAERGGTTPTVPRAGSGEKRRKKNKMFLHMFLGLLNMFNPNVGWRWSNFTQHQVEIPPTWNHFCHIYHTVCLPPKFQKIPWLVPLKLEPKNSLSSKLSSFFKNFSLPFKTRKDIKKKISQLNPQGSKPSQREWFRVRQQSRRNGKLGRCTLCGSGGRGSGSFHVKKRGKIFGNCSYT